MNKLVVIDGNSLMHRAFHALPPMNSADGTPTNAIYGFLNMLLKVIDEEQPDHLMVAFDMHAPTFRHLAYGQYKAGRKATPDELRAQFPLIRELLGQMGVAVCEQEGYEADDMLGIFSRRAQQKNMPAVLVTGDRDALQLVTEETTVVLTKKGITDTARYTPAVLREQYGVEPLQMVEVKSLMGDASDNIPGVPGVGEKTALKLIQTYGTLEEVLSHIDEISGAKLRERLRDNEGLARMSLDLARIVIDPAAPVALTVEECAFERSTLAGGRDMLRRLELRSLLRRLSEGGGKKKEEAPEEKKAAAAERTVLENAQQLSEVFQTLPERLALVLTENALSAAADGEREYVLPLDAQLSLLGSGVELSSALEALRPLLESEAVKMTLYDNKRWMHLLKEYGIALRGADFDVMLAGYLIRPTRTAAGLPELIEEHLGEEKAACAAKLWSLTAVLHGKMKQMGLWELFCQMEIPLVRVLYEMEVEGFTVDGEVLRELGRQFSGEIESLMQEIYDLAGEEFNILSPKQLGAILFEKLGLPAVRKTKTGYSTDADTLEYLAERHPIAQKVIDYRQLTKLKSTYIDGLLAAMDQNGRVHSSFNQTVTATGRISSTEPNLQNIPVRTAIGREIRKAFIASEGNLLVGGDYSQIELRVLAHMADDPIMCESFQNGEDIHARTAAEVFGVPLELVSGEMRSAAKAVNFGIVYGISDFGLAKNIGISRYQAGQYIEAYLEKYPGVHRYMKEVVEKAKKDGYVSTLMGRRRDVPELKSSNFNTRSFGERVAMNAPIQGTAADIIKLAMVRMEEALRENGLRARLILQVHDELIVDTPEDEVETVRELLKRSMESVVELRAPLVADVRCGRSWYDTK